MTSPSSNAPAVVLSHRALLVSLVLGALSLGALSWPYTVDDAYVIGRYAARLAHGEGYTFVEGPPTDGITGPPFVLIGTLGASAGLDPVDVAKGFGLVCGVLAIAILHRAARRRVVGNLSAHVACAFLTLAPSYLTWSVAGLETGLAALACILLAESVLLTPRPWSAGLWAALLVSLRPECAPLVAALISYLVRRRRQKHAWPAMVLPVLALLGVAAFRFVTFGSIDPLSLAAKPADLAHGAQYAFRVLTYGTALTSLPFAVLAARGSRRMRVLGVALIVHLLAIVLAGGDWMPGVRLFVPALPLLAWMVGVGAADLVRRRASPTALPVAIAGLLTVPALLFAYETYRARQAGEAREHGGRALIAALERIDAHRVALIDIGFVAYASDLTPIDLGGITDPSIGRLPGGHLDKPITGAMLIDRDPDALVLHSSSAPRIDEDGHLTALGGFPLERRLAMDENIRSAFRAGEVIPYAEGYYYVILTRR
jgi:hypothetical protein